MEGVEIFKTMSVVKELTPEGKLTIVFANEGTPDLEGDTFSPGSLYSTGKIAMAQFNHSLALPVGVGELARSGNDVTWSGQLRMSDPVAANHFEQMKAMGPDQEFSFRAFIEEYTRNSETGGFNFYKARVIETSPVLAGAGADTRIVAMKSLEARGVDTSKLLVREGSENAEKTLSPHLIVAAILR